MVVGRTANEAPSGAGGRDEATEHAPWRPMIAPRLELLAVGDGWTVRDPRDGATFALNDTSAAIWSLCDGSLTEREIAAELAGAYGISARRSLAEVRVFLAALDDMDLLVRSEGDDTERAL